jgi:hypothetical protein
MKILQFNCPLDPPASQLKALMLEQVNTWSRLSRLSSDPDYTTAPFGADVWKEHTTTPGLWWVDWGSIYEHLGNDGRAIADQLLGDKPFQGVLRLAPLVQALPNVRIQIVDVDDLVAAGYLPEPVVQPIEPAEPIEPIEPTEP